MQLEFRPAGTHESFDLPLQNSKFGDLLGAWHSIFTKSWESKGTNATPPKK